MSETLLFTKENGVGIIKLNRPEVYNSFTRDMALAMQAALDECKADTEVRAIYITAQGKAFSAGQDLQEAIGDNDLDLVRILQEHFNPLVTRLRTIEKPIVAAVNGVAAGAAANLAFACDIVVASEKASFIQAFSKIGLIPDSAGTYFLPRLIGFQKASALMMLGDKVSATDAEKMGMIYKVLPAESFAEDSMAIALKLAQMPTKGLGYTKRALNESLSNDLERQLFLEIELQDEAGQTSDYQEGVNAFLEKRKANFTGV